MPVLPVADPAFSRTMIFLHPFSAAAIAAANPAPPPPITTISALRFFEGIEHASFEFSIQALIWFFFEFSILQRFAGKEFGTLIVLS
jgi:hypothetical protein